MNRLSSLARGQVFSLFALLAFASLSCLALQNIRIQVNNENLQSPPYLLEALKQASAADGGPAVVPAGVASAPPPTSHQQAGPASSLAGDSSSLSDTRLQSQAAADQQLGRHEVPTNQLAGSSGPANVANSGSVKEEAIEELLDLEPESVLRLSPDGIINGVPSQDNSAAASERIEHHEQPQAAALVSHEVQNARKPQLPVTSSHLKRPALKPDPLDDRPASEPLGSRTNSSSELGGGGGAKSRVSPSVLVDDGPAVNLEKKVGAQPPDTWEPSQVMQGDVSNTSLVPATVRRQYGHQTRTRITLGGGYTRPKLPPLVNPTSSDYQDERPEKPLLPLERPTNSHHLSEGSSVDSSNDYDQSGSGIVENSRLVEVPERIVVPVGVFNQEDQTASVVVTKRPSSNSTRKRDSRCPANGITSIEHPTACDKYFVCEDGLLSEHTCPNGLLYGTRDVVRDYCVHRWEAVCGDKSIPNPISSPGCRWQNGIFNVQGSPKCVPDFYECKDGQFEVRKCSIGGQVYDDKTKSCRYAEQVGCTQEALADFRCPADDQTNTYWPFPRYFLNERALIHCVNDKPEIIRCRDHERVDPEHLFCVPLNKSDAAASGGDESAGNQPEMTARRSPANSNGQHREKAAKPTATQQASVAKAT